MRREMVQQVWQQEWLQVPHSRRRRQAGHVSADRKIQGKFCSNCGKPMPQEITEWTCECGQKNTGKFCTNCGKPLPVNTEWTCECGQKIQVNSAVIVENQEHKMLQSCNLCVKIFESRTNVGV